MEFVRKKWTEERSWRIRTGGRGSHVRLEWCQGGIREWSVSGVGTKVTLGRMWQLRYLVQNLNKPYWPAKICPTSHHTQREVGLTDVMNQTYNTRGWKAPYPSKAGEDMEHFLVLKYIHRVPYIKKTRTWPVFHRWVDLGTLADHYSDKMILQKVAGHRSSHWLSA